MVAPEPHRLGVTEEVHAGSELVVGAWCLHECVCELKKLKTKELKEKNLFFLSWSIGGEK